MDGASVAALQGGRDPDLGRERVADCLPRLVDAPGLELQAQGVNGVIGEHADEQVAFDPSLDLVVDGPEAEVGFERPEDRLQIGEHRIDPP